MREDPATVSSQSMAFADCMTPAAPSAENKGVMRKNWRNRIRFLLKTNSAQPASQVKNKSYRPSADDVNHWAQSFDKLLSHKYGRAAFRIFLKSEFCDENIEFWAACEDFRTLASLKQMVSKANSIYEEFIKCDAPKEINLDFHTKNAIAQCLREPTATSFLAAQRKVYSLMENNSYPRFINSDLYKEVCAVARGEAEHVKS